MGGARAYILGAARDGSIALLAVASLVATGCGSSESSEPPTPPAAVITGDPARAFAPLVHLYENERAKPIGAMQFLEGSSLGMSNDPCFLTETVAVSAMRLRIKRDEPAPVLYPRRLAERDAYRTKVQNPDCVGRQRRSYGTGQHTRPFDAGRPAGMHPKEGFFLNLLTDRLHGMARYVRDGDQLRVAGMPVYYDRRTERVDGSPGVRITYWLLFGLDAYPEGSPAASLTHEGDWERISVLLRRGPRADAWRPVSVRYHAHGSARDVPWESVEVARGSADGPASHPVAYAAGGNHALYPRDGDTTIARVRDDGARVRTVDRHGSCSDCPTWSTWEILLPARRQPWYGYGGAWGAVGPSDATSGPIGPSPFTR
jgi:hypothetical protein